MRKARVQLVPIIYSRVIARKAGQTKDQMKRVLQGTGVDEGSEKNNPVGMTVGQYRTLLANAQRVSGDKYIALKASLNLPVTIHGPVGLAVSTSDNLQTALEVNAHYGCLRNPFSYIALVPSGTYTSYIMDVNSEVEEQTDSALDFMLSAMAQSIMGIPGLSREGFHLSLKRPAPKDAQIFESLAPCPVRYNQSENAIVFLTSELSRELPGANEEVYRDAIERCEAIYSLQYISTNEVDRVCSAFVRMSGQVCTILQITEDMGMSIRTLQRRLKDRGTTFQTLLDGWLAKEASKYMLGENLTVEVTSVLLGYSDEANFRRAFKRWYGMPAGVYRENGGSNLGQNI